MPTTVVLVTETEFRRARSTFSDAGELECIPVGAEDPLCEAIVQHGTRLVVVGSSPHRGRLYSTLPRGGVIARFGVGYDNVDTAQATRAGVLCTNTPDVLQQSVAELTMFMMGMAARHLVAVSTGVQGGRWEPRKDRARRQDAGADGVRSDRPGGGTDCCGGFGMRVVGYARSPREVPSRDFTAVSTDYVEVARSADFVSLHIPGSLTTRSS